MLQACGLLLLIIEFLMVHHDTRHLPCREITLHWYVGTVASSCCYAPLQHKDGLFQDPVNEGSSHRLHQNEPGEKRTGPQKGHQPES